MSRLVKKVFMSCQHEHNLNLGDIYLQRSCVVKLEKKKKKVYICCPYKKYDLLRRTRNVSKAINSSQETFSDEKKIIAQHVCR